MDQQRQFKGVWFPKELWLCKELTWKEKAFLVEIDSLEDEVKGCFASNKHFMELFDMTSTHVSRTIQSLNKKGYIRLDYERKGKEILSRKIFLNRPPYPEKWGMTKMDIGYDQNGNRGMTKMVKENNTYLRNNINIYIVEQVISYLNDKLKTSYKATTNKTKTLINARVNEGFTLDDFKKVVDTMYNEWHNDIKMKVYLRPETLFGTKFESYLNRNNKKRVEELCIPPKKERELTDEEKRIVNEIINS